MTLGAESVLLLRRSNTCLPASPLNTEHLAGSPQGWAGQAHSNRCFSPPCPVPPPSSGEPLPSGPVPGDPGP